MVVIGELRRSTLERNRFAAAATAAADGGGRSDHPWRHVSAATGEVSERGAASKPRRFDPLAVSVVLRSERVTSGKTLHSRLIVENRSATSVVDPGCDIGEGRYALAPADDPDAELWVQPGTDCGGPYGMEPGFRDEWRGADFPAPTKYGDPLPPGGYLAVLEIRGLSQRLEYPVTVE